MWGKTQGVKLWGKSVGKKSRVKSWGEKFDTFYVEGIVGAKLRVKIGGKLRGQNFGGKIWGKT